MARPPQPELVAALSALVTAEHVSTTAPDRIAYSADLWPKTQIWKLAGDIDRYPPDAIVWPANEEELAAVLAYCSGRGVPVIPYGAGSGVAGGTLPLHGGVIVDVKRMDDILDIDHDSRLVTVQAGLNGQQFEDRLNAHGLTLGHFPSSIMCSTIGGWLACRSAGQFSSRYGKIEDMVVSLRCVLPSGEVLDTADRAVGDPDWTQLIVGSEGTLGLIASATLMVEPLPEARALRGYRFRHLTDGLQAMRLVMQAGLRPMVLRLYDPFDSMIAMGRDTGDQEEASSAQHLMDLVKPVVEGGAHRATRLRDRISAKLQPVAKAIQNAALAGALQMPAVLNRLAHSAPSPCLMIIGFEGPGETVRDDMWRATRILADIGGVDAGTSVGKAWLAHRYRVSFKQSRMYAAGAFVDTMEVATTWDRLEALYDGVVRAIGPHAFIMAHFSHAYRDGCSIYFTFAAYRRDPGRLEQTYDRVWRSALEAVHQAGGTASHHHGVGLSKMDAMPAEHGEMLRIWAALKAAMDPNGVMNPGKLFPTPVEPLADPSGPRAPSDSGEACS